MLINHPVTDRTASRANSQCLDHSEHDSVIFHPARRTRCTDVGEIWQGEVNFSTRKASRSDGDPLPLFCVL